MRYPGSKWKISRYVVPLIPYDAEYYHEPFLGLGYVFRRLRLEGRSFKAYYLSDLFEPLINYHLAVQGDTTYGDIIERVAEAHSIFCPELANEQKIRAEFDECCYRLKFWNDPYDIAFVMSYANGQFVGRHRKSIASFHPRYFGGGIGSLTREKLLQWRRLLSNATIQGADAFTLLRDLNHRDDAYKHICYLDPPFLPRDLRGQRSRMYQHDFVGSVGFDQQRELLALLKAARFRFILSMGDSPFTRDWYLKDKRFHPLRVPLVNSGRRTKSGAVHDWEWLFTNYPLDF